MSKPKIVLNAEKKAGVEFHGKSVMQYTYRSDKHISNEGIDKFIGEQKSLKDIVKDAKNKHNKDVEFAVTTYLPTGPYTSAFTSFNNINCFDMKPDSYDVLAGNNIVRSFTLYMRVKSDAKGGNSKDEHNDCLYNCLKTAFGSNADLLPRDIRKPRSLKTRLGLERDDKIPIKKLQILEELYNFSFTVSGDCTYISKVSKPININLNLSGEHYTLKCNINRTKTIGVFFKPAKKVVSVKTDIDGKMQMYNGKKIVPLEYDKFVELKDFKNETLVIKCNSKEDLVNVRDEFVENADLLIKETKGFINMYKYYNASYGSFELWRILTKALIEPDVITDVEGLYLDRAFAGGHHYAEKYEGMGYSYDLNSMYLYYMSMKSFTVPFKQGTFKTITTDEFEKLEFYPYGIYRCNVIGSHKFFKAQTKKNRYYTHFDLQLCKLINLKVSIIEDDSANCLLYEKDRVNGDKAFGSFTDYIYDLKKRKFPVKPFTNVWGVFSQKNVKKLRGTAENPVKLDKSGDFADEIYQQGDHTVVLAGNVNDLFKFKYARIGIFVTSFCRLQFAKLCLPFIDNIKRINTDSMLTDIDISAHLTIGKELGDFKIENASQCKVIDSNHVEWYDEDGNIIKKK